MLIFVLIVDNIRVVSFKEVLTYSYICRDGKLLQVLMEGKIRILSVFRNFIVDASHCIPKWNFKLCLQESI